MSNWNDEISRNYLDSFADHVLNLLWLEHVDLHEGDFLLDIGCGGGGAIKAALQNCEALRVVGVDPMQVMLTAAREIAPRADFYLSGAEDIPLPGNVVTCALANCSISHWQDRTAGLNEVGRVLKSGGRFLIIEEAFSFQSEDGATNSPEELPAQLEKAGFQVQNHGPHQNQDVSYWATLAVKP